jgi:hypothetical protein
MRSGCDVGFGIGKVNGKYAESSSMGATDMVGVYYSMKLAVVTFRDISSESASKVPSELSREPLGVKQ